MIKSCSGILPTPTTHHPDLPPCLTPDDTNVTHCHTTSAGDSNTGSAGAQSVMILNSLNPEVSIWLRSTESTFPQLLSTHSPLGLMDSDCSNWENSTQHYSDSSALVALHYRAKHHFAPKSKAGLPSPGQLWRCSSQQGWGKLHCWQLW